MERVLLPLALLLSSSFESIFIHNLQKNGDVSPPIENMIIVSEFIKLIVSTTLIFVTKRHIISPVKILTNTHYFIPVSLIYVVSNNIVYLALKELSPSMFNLLTNLKIPVTVLLASICLKKTNTFNYITGYSILFILTGNGIATINKMTSGSNSGNSLLGIGLMIIYSMCSGGAAVYCEYLLKNLLFQENIFVQNVKFCICSILINGIVCIYNGNLLEWNGIYNYRVILAVSGMAANGIATSLVIKYLGSIYKTYTTSISVFLTLIISYIFGMHADLNVFFFTGCFFSIIGVFLYNKSKNVALNYFDEYSNEDNANYTHQIYHNDGYRYQPIRHM